MNIGKECKPRYQVSLLTEALIVEPTEYVMYTQLKIYCSCGPVEKEMVDLIIYR